MRKSWLLCVLLGTLAWGQAQPVTPPAQANPAPSAATKAPAAPAAELPESAVVLTIKGVCPAAPKTPAAKTAGGKTATTPAKKPADCKTEITRAQFEKIASSVSATPTVAPQLKRQLETALPGLIAMSEAAKAKGLDKSPRFLERVKIDKMQILATELRRTVQADAENIPPAKVAEYYKSNPEAYEQFSLDRLFIPRYKQVVAEDKDDTKEPEKLTEEQQKAKEAADQAKQAKGEQDLNALAESLRVRAAAGEDFVKLQKEAFEAAGTKADNPTVNLPKVRRTGLSAAQASVFELKVGEVSGVISDNGGHYVYKVVSKEVLPLDDQVQNEIRTTLKNQRMKDMMDKYTNSFQAVPNEAYFGPPEAAGRPGPPHARPGMFPPPNPQSRPQNAPPPGASQQSAPPATNAPTQPPATTPPPAKPN
jgi:hypothetical protein